jgi:hypothetical protein
LISLTLLALIHYVEMRPQLNLATARALVLCYSSVFASAIGGNNGFAVVGVYSGLLVDLTIFLLSNVPFRQSEMKSNSVMLLYLLSIIVIIGTILYSYRQPSLFVQGSPISIGGHTVLIDSARATEMMELRQCLVQNELMGKITLDFTGNFAAGLIFVLGSQSPKNLLGTVWGYDGSELLMQETIRGLPSFESTKLLLFDKEQKEERLSAAERITGSSRNSLNVVCSTSTWEIRRW